MPLVLAILGILAGAYFWANRARNAADAAVDIADMANDVRLAARRFGFKRKTNIHPAESIEEPNLAIAGIAIAMVELQDFPTQEDRDALNVSLRAETRVDQETADELIILGRWMVNECGGAAPAISRLARKLFRIGGSAQFEPLLTIIQSTLSASGKTLNDTQRDALDEIKAAFKVR